MIFFPKEKKDALVEAYRAKRLWEENPEMFLNDQEKKEIEDWAKTIISRKIPDTYPSACFNNPLYRVFLERMYECIGGRQCENHNVCSYINASSYAAVYKDWTKWLAKGLRGKRCLEVMAGNGMLAKAITDENTVKQYMATDNFEYFCTQQMGKLWYDVTAVTAQQSIYLTANYFNAPVDYVIMAWPPEGGLANEFLNLMREWSPDTILIYIGEGKGGKCANDKFFNKIEPVTNISCYLEEAMNEYHGLYNDRIMIVK